MAHPGIAGLLGANPNDEGRVRPALRLAIAGSPSLEARMRIEEMSYTIDVGPRRKRKRRSNSFMPKAVLVGLGAVLILLELVFPFIVVDYGNGSTLVLGRSLFYQPPTSHTRNRSPSHGERLQWNVS
jgi:hypothetical protein